MMVFCMDDMIPQDHLLRLIDRGIDWSLIYDLVGRDTAMTTVDRAWTRSYNTSMESEVCARLSAKLRSMSPTAGF